MGIGLWIIGSCAFMVALVLLIKNIIKKESKKKSIILLLISLFLVCAGISWVVKSAPFFLLSLSSFGFCGALGILIRNFIKKRPKKKPLIALVVSFLLVFVGLIWGGSTMTPEEIAASQQAKADKEAKAQADAEANTQAEEEAKAQSDAEAKVQAEEEAKAQSDAEAKAQAEEEAKAQASAETETQAESKYNYKVGDTSLAGVTMTEDLITYLENAENSPISSKEEAESLTKEIYTDVTNQDGKMMSNEEMMTKLYKAEIYYAENMNSQYYSLNSLLIEEFGGRINGTRTSSGAVERMSNIKDLYTSIQESKY